MEPVYFFYIFSVFLNLAFKTVAFEFINHWFCIGAGLRRIFVNLLTKKVVGLVPKYYPYAGGTSQVYIFFPNIR